MDRLYWAFGSMLIVAAIIYFSPIGLTKAGKAIIVPSGLLLAFGGLAAIGTFSLLQTFLLLTILILFVSLILDSRLGHLLYTKNIGSNASDSLKEEELPFARETARDEIKQSQTQLVLNNKNPASMIEDLPTPLLESGQEMDEDIELLLNREFIVDTEESLEISVAETDYLAEIEGLLETGMENREDALPLTSDEHFLQSSAVELDELDVIDNEEIELPLLVPSGSKEGK